MVHLSAPAKHAGKAASCEDIFYRNCQMQLFPPCSFLELSCFFRASISAVLIYLPAAFTESSPFRTDGSEKTAALLIYLDAAGLKTCFPHAE